MTRPDPAATDAEALLDELVDALWATARESTWIKAEFLRRITAALEGGK